MSEAADVHAEILKLARLLSRDPADLVYLADAPPADLRRMREQVADVLFDAHGHALGRLATASKLLPAALPVASTVAASLVAIGAGYRPSAVIRALAGGGSQNLRKRLAAIRDVRNQSGWQTTRLRKGCPAAL